MIRRFGGLGPCFYIVIMFAATNGRQYAAGFIAGDFLAWLPGDHWCAVKTNDARHEIFRKATVNAVLFPADEVIDDGGISTNFTYSLTIIRNGRVDAECDAFD